MKEEFIHKNKNKNKMAAPMKHVKNLGKLVFESSSFENTQSKYRKHIQDHYFNSSVDVLLPGCEALPRDIDTALYGQVAFLAASVPLSLLVTPDFIEGFIKKGSVYGITWGRNIDSDDCVALLPTGVLVLNLCKDTFQELGLDGQPSNVGKHSGKYVVEVNLTGRGFHPGKKWYERVKWCLSERLELQFDMLLAWEPHDEKICSTSIQKYFQLNDVRCSRLEISKKVRNYKGMTVPVIQSAHFDSGSGECCHYTEVFEWLGAMATEIDTCECDADSYVSTYCCPTPSDDIKVGVSMQYSGLFTPSNIASVVESLRVHICSRGLPWATITVHGFADSPVSWATKQHGFSINGDNLYTFLVFPSQDYWLYTATGSLDTCV